MNPWIIPGIINNIEAIVASVYGVTVTDLRSRSRLRPLPEARHTAMYFLKKRYPNLTWAEVASRFGRDHSTAIFASKKVSEYLQFDKDYLPKFNSIQNLIQ